MTELQNIVENLKSNNGVDAVFLTGSFGANKKPYSDIDLIIVLRKNVECIRSVFTWIDGMFADVYFFDLENIEKIKDVNWSPISSDSDENKHRMNRLLIYWLKEGSIQFDKSGKLTELKSKEIDLNKVGKGEKENYWMNINYNFEANTRYFNSDDPIYLEALEIRLLYSMPQVICGYFVFRDIPWHGEKNAVKYFKEKDLVFYKEFMGFYKSSTLKDKFKHYNQMVKLVFVSDYFLWSKDGIYSKRIDDAIDLRLAEYWKNLIS